MIIYATLAIIKVDISGIDRFFTSLMPEQIHTLTNAFFEHLAKQDNVSFLVLGIALTLYTMARYIRSLGYKIKSMYGVTSEKNLLSRWGISLVFSLLMISAFYLTLFLLMTGESLFDFIGRYLYISDIFIRLWLFFRFFIISACAFILVFLIYCILPGVRQKITDLIPGTLFAMMSWIIISACFSYYMDNIARYSYLYGSIGAFIVLLLWFFLTNIVLLAGGAINSMKYRSSHHENHDPLEPLQYQTFPKKTQRK